MGHMYWLRGMPELFGRRNRRICGYSRRMTAATNVEVTDEIPAQKPPTRRNRRVLACVLVGLGSFLLTAAIMVPTYTADRVKKIPLDIEANTVSNSIASVIDSASTALGQPRTDTNVPVRIQVYVTTEDPVDANVTTLQASQLTRRTDREGDAGIISGSVDRVTVDRSTALPVPGGVATTQSVSDKPPVETPREGMQYKFPFDTQKQSYLYYDGTARQSFDIDYVDDDREVNGLRLFHFRQVIEPINLRKTIGKDATLTLPAESWGLPGGATPFSMDLFYSNTRDIWIEPVSGSTVAVEESPHRYLARSVEDPLAVTSFEGKTQFDETTVNALADQARTAKLQIQWGTRYGPALLGILGIGLLGAGVVVGRRAWH